jgi:ubiquinone/menaquinone biosynthesis C-methylase UbiE
VSTNPIPGERSELPCAELEEGAGWRSQFALPRGALGHAAGWLMGRKNSAMNAALVEWLAPQPGERVVELGSGHGRTLASIAERVSAGEGGRAVGVDPSDTMLRQAARRNRRAVAAGHVQLAPGDARDIPFPDASFDKLLASNCVQFWGDLARALSEIRRVLVSGGGLLIGMRVHDPDGGRFASPGFREEQIEHVRAAVDAAGFHSLRRLERHAGRDVVALHALRP